MDKKIVGLVSGLIYSLWHGCMADIWEAPKHPVYIGLIGGYGSTTWGGLVPSDATLARDPDILLSTPLMVREGGRTWGFFSGYEFGPWFAVEGAYMRYPLARASFDRFSRFNTYHDGESELYTNTDTVSIMAKVMLAIPNTELKFFSSLGLAGIHRKDFLLDQWRKSPTFGAGVNYHLSEHLMGEVNGTYTAGFGESELDPVDTYIPFLYAVTFRIAYLL